MNTESVVCTYVDIQETSKLQESTQARKMREVFAKVGVALQMSMRKRHHCQKIFDPAKRNEYIFRLMKI